MRVYYQSDNNCLFVQGTRDAYPAKSLTWTRNDTDNERINIWVQSGELAIASNHWTRFENYNYVSFSSQAEVEAYLTEQFSRSYENLDIINDTINTEGNVYSAEKVEEKFIEEVGTEDYNFELLFENQLSQQQ